MRRDRIVGSVCPIIGESLFTNFSRIVLVIDVWSKTVLLTDFGSTHGETMNAGTRGP